MRIRSSLIATAILLVSTQAWALSKVQMNLVPAPADCFGGGPDFCWNVDGTCTLDNSECALGTISPKSQIKFDGRGTLRAKIFGVTDETGALMTTGPAETNTNNLVLKLTLSTCPVDTAMPACDTKTDVYLKVVLTAGRAVLNLSLAPVFSLPVGSAMAVSGVELLSRAAPACTGDNSTAAIAARNNDGANCDAGVVRASGGVMTQ